MSKFQKTFYRYSNCFKEKVVQEVLVFRMYVAVTASKVVGLVEAFWQERFVKYSNTSKNAQ